MSKLFIIVLFIMCSCSSKSLKDLRYYKTESGKYRIRTMDPQRNVAEEKVLQAAKSYCLDLYKDYVFIDGKTVDYTESEEFLPDTISQKFSLTDRADSQLDKQIEEEKAFGFLSVITFECKKQTQEEAESDESDKDEEASEDDSDVEDDDEWEYVDEEETLE